MYTVTLLQGALLALAVLATTTMLVLGVLVGLPRTLRVVHARVYCPLVRRRVMAELDRDEWTLRVVDVARCSVLGKLGVTTCTKRCLSRTEECLARCA